MFLRKFIPNERGATSIEYGLIVMLVAVAIAAAIAALGVDLTALFSDIGGELQDATSSSTTGATPPAEIVPAPTEPAPNQGPTRPDNRVRP